MEPARKIPLLPLDSMNSPSQILKNYLGIELNNDDRYLSVYSNGTVCHIWSRRIREREEASLQNVCQEEIFKYAIRLLKEKRPLNAPSDLSICYAQPKESGKMDKLENRAELIVAVFHSRFCSDPYLESYHRKNLALALKWHKNAYFRTDTGNPIKVSTSCPTMTQSKDIRSVSLECLSYCRTYWLGKSPNFENEASKLEFDRLQQTGFLLKPQMGPLLECELEKNIEFSFSGEYLASDIGRCISHISVSNSCSSSIFPKYTKKLPENDLDRFNIQSCRFQNLLTNLMLGLSIGFNKREELKEKWSWHVKKEQEELNNDSFTYAVKGFFEQELNPLDREEYKLRQLLILLRQRFYMHPLLVIREGLQDLPLYFKPDHPSRLMAYHFIDHKIEYQVSYVAEATYEQLKSVKLNKKYPPYEMRFSNTMRASLNDLSSWSSEISIELSSVNKKGTSVEILQQKVLEPLQKLGFKSCII